MGQNKILKQRKAGFTLVEMSVVLGMMSILLLIMSAQIIMAYDSMKYISNSSQLVEVEREVKIALDDTYQCTTNLKGMNIAPVGETIPLTALKEFKIVPNPSQLDVIREIVLQNTRVNGLLTKSMALRTLTQSSPTEFVVQVEINFNGLNSDDTTILRKFPMYTVVSNAEINQCSASSDGGWLLREHNCGLQPGGFYDTQTGQCKYPTYVWVNGDEAQSQCGSGQGLGVGSTKANSCAAIPPAGFDDTLYQAATRTYADGTTVSNGPGPWTATLNVTTGQCTCLYATGIDPSGWTCQVRCLE